MEYVTDQQVINLMEQVCRVFPDAYLETDPEGEAIIVTQFAFDADEGAYFDNQVCQHGTI